VNTPLLSVKELEVWFRVRSGGKLRAEYRDLKAVDGISFDLNPGETLGVVGESGCGKSTLARAILMLIAPTRGSVVFMGRNLSDLRKAELRASRSEMQMVFQDPLASLDPRMSVGSIIGEPLRAFAPHLRKAERAASVRDMLDKVGLLPSAIDRYPHEFSGGQCQRIGIARAMILQPKLVICDEPVSALDVSIQAQIINLLMDLQQEFRLSLVFVSHDLSVIRHISNRVMVMYLGRVMEIAARDELFSNPQHPYTQALISAVPSPEAGPGVRRIMLSPDLPSPLDPPSGCVFHTRCPRAERLCREASPELRERGPGQRVACHCPG
jgi:oligopeptide transport system ATP-binding protein